jgi:hypothetical protein
VLPDWFDFLHNLGIDVFCQVRGVPLMIYLRLLELVLRDVPRHYDMV